MEEKVGRGIKGFHAERKDVWEGQSEWERSKRKEDDKEELAS